MQKHNLEDIIFTYQTYKNGLEWIGYANCHDQQAGIVKAEFSPRLKAINMFRLFTFAEFRGIGVASTFLTSLAEWGKEKNATDIICALMYSSMMDDNYEHLDHYLIRNGFIHHGLLLTKKLT